ncbi:HD-GYP domain-containing protein [Pseudomaricurvus sp. HS19]|uniref:HD-GYP domain-containing protein n=1 Tax=Pseudomaricurvus sp. HS19 TaxID=2692626 RepID=UPI00136B0FBE|nr:HD-GYP domain-containing protein [Pseudomaricurvus sp. HS19]MYM63759.1 DUF3391 domain-containing protein [Pseudomaricurvus sp. HS19]
MPTELTEIKIPVEKLELGMHVIRLDKPWEETDFLIQGFVIQDRKTLQELTEQCSHVYIEGRVTHNLAPAQLRTQEPPKEKKGLFSRFSRSRPTPPADAKSGKSLQGPPPAEKRVRYINKIPTERELPEAKGTYDFAKTTVVNIMDGIRLGRTIDMNQARATVTRIVDSVLRNKDALAWLTRIKNKDEYTAEHSLNVSILAATFARHLGHTEEEIAIIALGGLLHDVGKAKIPTEILNKEGRLTNEEFALMRQHAVFGRNLLMSAASKDKITIDIAHSHHERVDGKGYPRKLQAHQIPYYAKVIAIADTYDAITSNRCYDSGRSSMEALDIIYHVKGEQFDEALALEFIRCIGVYPPGAIVEMNTGEVGLVVNTHEQSKLKPRILMVLDKNKERVAAQFVDLAKISQGVAFSIKRELINGSHGVFLEDFLKRGSLFKPSGDSPA